MLRVDPPEPQPRLPESGDVHDRPRRLEPRRHGQPIADRDGDAVTADRPSRRRGLGQGLVEFALGITVFLTILIGLVDLARAAFLFNGVSDAARELARVTSVHPGTTTLGASGETSAA